MSRYRRVAAIAVSTLAGAAGVVPVAHADVASTVYVDKQNTSCSDTAAGAGTYPTPFCTIPGALASPTVGSGTTIALHGAIPGGIDITKSGITIAGGFVSTIQGGAYGMSITGQHDVRLDHVRFVGQTGEAVRVDSSSNITLSTVSASFSQSGATDRDPSLPAIRLTGVTGATVTGGAVHDNPGPGLAVQNSSQVVVTDEEVAANGGGGIQIADATTADLVSDTVDENCGAGISVQGASSDVTIANTIDSNARTCGAVAGAALSVTTSGPAPTIDSNIITTTAGADAVHWQGQTLADGPALDAAGHGTHDLSVDPGFATTPVGSSFWRGNFGLTATSPAVDSADSGARDEPARDASGNPRIDDPRVTDSGTGPVAYADRGAVEFTRSVLPHPAVTASVGPYPDTYQQVTVYITGDGGSWWPVVSYDIDFGDGSSTGPQPYPGSVQLTHAYTEDKTYNGNVTITDSQGQTSVTPFSAAIAKHSFSPTLSLTPTDNQQRPGEVTADIFAPLEGACLGSYDIDFGDESPHATDVIGPYIQIWHDQVAHTYTKSGTYTVVATAKDCNWWPNDQPMVKTISVAVPTPSNPTPPPPVPTPTGPAQPTVHRIGGTDRYDTARRVSQAQWKPGSTSAVVLARGDQAPDALSGVPFAAHVHGPLLLTDPAALDDATRAEIDRVTSGPGPSKTVYILGGEAAVSPAVEAGLRKAGYTVVRYQGADRFRTSLAVAAAFGDTSHVIVATGRDFPDALAAGPLGAVENAPVVLSDGDTLDPAVAGFVQAHSAIDPVGGAAQRAVAKISADGRIVNHGLAGATRYETAAAVARAVAQAIGHVPAGVGIASGEVFPDALTGGAYAANVGIPLLITEPGTLSYPVRAELSSWANNLKAVTVFGGPKAVSDRVENDIAGAVGGKIQ